ncbi:hypothetical protein ppKF707_4839 [Metapseudomonas furukawaii]|uniref:Uncharacterized protein n=1 Tax=Metapseudomonas furukawaii TaxID=1149133 RepID=A0AAD1FE38_METFU|nr:hypothetical protein ppKF707_4839 [Pseudomonas furukawaii]BAU72582.1 hypothetical protein KF707C_8940 [Pseudomonas furukawaii]
MLGGSLGERNHLRVGLHHEPPADRTLPRAFRTAHLSRESSITSILWRQK